MLDADLAEALPVEGEMVHVATRPIPFETWAPDGEQISDGGTHKELDGNAVFCLEHGILFPKDGNCRTVPLVGSTVRSQAAHDNGDWDSGRHWVELTLTQEHVTDMGLLDEYVRTRLSESADVRYAISQGYLWAYIAGSPTGLSGMRRHAYFAPFGGDKHIDEAIAYVEKMRATSRVTGIGLDAGDAQFACLFFVEHTGRGGLLKQPGSPTWI